MLPLSDTTRWEQLRASPGGTGLVARDLLLELGSAATSDWREVYHQACHQLTVANVAYAIVPHAIRIAEARPAAERLVPLEIAGTVFACLDAFPSQAPECPPELDEPFCRSIDIARRMALGCLERNDWSRGEAIRLMGVTAAFQGLTNLAIHLFLHGGSQADLHCPSCGEYIRWSEASPP